MILHILSGRVIIVIPLTNRMLLASRPSSLQSLGEKKCSAYYYRTHDLSPYIKYDEDLIFWKVTRALQAMGDMFKDEIHIQRK